MRRRTVFHPEQEGLVVSPQSQTQLLAAASDTTQVINTCSFHDHRYLCFSLDAKCCAAVVVA